MSNVKNEILLCNCEASMKLDGTAIARACNRKKPFAIAEHLCRSQISQFSNAVQNVDNLLVACTQEAPLFREVAQEAETAGAVAEISFFNIRERAGWSQDSDDNSAKIAALINAASHQATPAASLNVRSDGICLVYGTGQEALQAAQDLQPHLAVTLILKDGSQTIPPSLIDVPIFQGSITKAQGHFGAFELSVNNYAPVIPSSRDELRFEKAKNNVATTCSLILDLTGDTPLFTAADLRDGYKAVDPRDPAAIARAILAMADLAGEFEKPLYVNFKPDICAHSRSKQPGCQRCIDVCPAGAITSDGDHITINPVICGGCGSCAAICPTGAASYALPLREDILQRLDILAQTYIKNAKKRPALLLHDGRHGGELIALSARFGRGLPHHILPLEINEISQIGHEVFIGALAAGFVKVFIVSDPQKRAHLSAVFDQIELSKMFLSGLGFGDSDHIVTIDENDPDLFEAALWSDLPTAQYPAHKLNPLGSKREISRVMIGLLHENAPVKPDHIALPSGAPYGNLEVDKNACTLCLACVGSCPASALLDNPDAPQLRFIEQACVQCGLCANICPENAITLSPRYNFLPAALSPILLNEDAPFHCIRCDKPFGSTATVNRISQQLAGKHAMFQSDTAQQLIQMCDDCRVIAQAQSSDDPFTAGPRPAIRTTQDDLDERAQKAENNKLSATDFLIDD